MEKLFTGLYLFFRDRRLLLYIIFSLIILLLAVLASRVKFEEDISSILPKDEKTEKLNLLLQNAKFIDKTVVLVSLKDSNAVARPDSLLAFAESFAAQVQENLSPYIKRLNYRVEDSVALQLYGFIIEYLPLYLSETDYRSIDSLIQPERVKESLQQNIRNLSSPAGLALRSMITQDPVGITIPGLKKLQKLQYDEQFELYDNFVVTRDHRNLLMFIEPAFPPGNTGRNVLMLKGLDTIIHNLSTIRHPGTTAFYFGSTAVSAGNATQVRRDTFLTQGITVLFLVVFLGIYFRKKSAPFLILIPVVFGALFSLAAIYLIQGSISVIALGTGCIVLGIAVNYSLHVFNHYRHSDSMEEVIAHLARPLTIGSLTTIGGFLCLQFVQSALLQDLGLVASMSLVGASVCSLVFLPHFIFTGNQRKKHSQDRVSLIDRISSYRPEYNKYLVGVILALTVIFVFFAGDAGFEQDMMKMNYMSDELKQAEAKLNRINEFTQQSVYVVADGKDLDEALRNNEKLEARIDALLEKDIVKKYSGVSAVIMSDSLQKERIARWNAYWSGDKKQQLLKTLAQAGAELKFRPSAFEPFRNLLEKNYQPIDQDDLARIRKIFLDDYIIESQGRTSVVTMVRTTPEHKNAVYGYLEKEPNATVIDKQYFTGRLVESVHSDFTSIALMSSVLVFTVLLLSFGRIELALVSFIPMFITWIWILGIMGLTGIQFNLINVIISALIFGLGDDYSLFIMDGLLQEYKTGRKNLASYKSSILLSAITTIAGFGVLIFAKHPALRSIAAISMIGIGCVALISQVMIPFLFNILIRNRVKKNLFPWTLSGLFLSLFAFAYFVSGCILLTVIGFILLKLNPFFKEKAKLAFHTVISKFCWSMIYIMGNVKKKIINPLDEDFSKPAVIICNHQSFLDILSTIMLHPKVILLTNKWVWNSPVFGAVVRMAGYYPVMEGAEGSTDRLAESVKKGYSIVVFPEGTRSVDGNMKRFHKGAFYLAEKLQLDILPIILHGTGYTMTKGDFLLKNGQITVKFLPRIKYGDTAFGEGYAEKAKLTGRYFRKEFAHLRNEIEQTAYFKEQLIYNYIYKGPVLEWYMRIKIRLENNYQLFHELLPAKGNILDVGCGYGFMSYMLHFVSPGRNMTGIDYDEDKIATARHCFSRSDQVQFIHADVTNFVFEKYDAIILADMLHYLQPAQQKALIETCIKSLNAGGVIVIRDGNAELAGRHRGTRLTELFSTKLVKFNKTTGNGLSFMSGSEIREIAREQKMKCIEIDNTKFTSNVVFVISLTTSHEQ